MAERRRRNLVALAKLALVVEWRIWVSLVRWIGRRPAIGPGEQAFGYAGLVAGLLGLWIFASAAEIPLFHLILPWQTVREVLLVLSAWGLFWMLGYYGSHRAYPHAVGPAGLRLQNTVSLRLFLPHEQIATVEQHRRNEVRRGVRPDPDDPTVLVVAISTETNVRIRLTGPTVVELLSGPVAVVTVDLYVDDPKAFVAAAREVHALGA